MTRSYVVTGAGRGVGRAIAEHLAGEGRVVAVDRDADALAWTHLHADVVPVDGGRAALGQDPEARDVTAD